MAERARKWVDRYVTAWTSNDPDEIRGLFTEDAEYLTAPDAAPWRGRDAIVAGWLERRDEPEDWTFSYEVLQDTEDLAFVEGRTGYVAFSDCLNLWVIRFADDDRAASFTEWYMLRD